MRDWHVQLYVGKNTLARDPKQCGRAGSQCRRYKQLEDLTRCKNFLRAPQKSFLTSTSNTQHLQDLHATQGPVITRSCKDKVLLKDLGEI